MQNEGMRRRGIALFLRSLDNDFQQRVRDDALTTGKRLGFTVTPMGAQNDPVRQLAQITAALEAAPGGDLAAILVAPVRDDGLADLAQQAARADIGWTLLNRESTQATLPPFPGDEPTRVPAFCVSPDQLEIGRIQAEQAKVLAPNGGTIIAITGPARTSASRRRLEGLWTELGPNYALTLLEADWTTERARLVLDRWLAGLDGSTLPALIAAQNDEMALGARQALRDAASQRGLPALLDLPLIGCDGSPGLGQRLVRESRINATVTLPSPAGPALEWLARFRDTGELPPSQLSLPVASYPSIKSLRKTT
jgi:ABC-type sugar transport system substrate-binding protein